MLHDIAPHRYSVVYSNEPAKDHDILLLLTREGILCRRQEGETVYPTVSEVKAVYPEIAEKAVYFFRMDDTDYYGLLDGEVAPFDDWGYVSRLEMRRLRPMHQCFIGMMGNQLQTWYRDTRFCGRCGTQMNIGSVERAMVCPQCGKISYPQICPSVIVGVLHDGKILLTRYSESHGRARNHSLVAGYVEIGESLEDTIRREVMEEAGLKVKNIRYYDSQPWPPSGSLLSGYFCDLDGDDSITIDEQELSAAGWFTPDEIPEGSANGDISLTGKMIHAFKYGLI